MNKVAIRKIITQLYQAGIVVSQVDGQLKTRSKKGAFTPELIKLVKSNKDNLIAYLIDEAQAQDVAALATQSPIEVVKDRSGLHPLSFAQYRLWFIDQLQGGSANYNIPFAYRIRGDFDLSAAKAALYTIIERHHVLRTVYVETKDGPRQQLLEDFDCPFDELDLTESASGLAGQRQQQKVIELIEQDANRAFDLATDTMIRACWLQLSNDPQKPVGVLLFNMHHIASDGWSIGILMQEFIRLYQAKIEHREEILEPLPIQYLDYALWQRQQVQGDGLQKQHDYWHKQLDDAPPVHGLPIDFARSEQSKKIGGEIESSLGPEIAAQIKQMAKKLGVTGFMLLHGVLTLLIARHSGNDDVIVGTTVANRRETQLEPLIGFFVNTLVLRSQIKADCSIKAFFEQIKKINLEAQSNQDIPFDQLVESLNIPRSNTYSPLFQILFSMDTTETSSGADMPELGLEPLEGGQAQVKFELTLASAISNDGLLLHWTYDTSVFSADNIQRLDNHFKQLIQSLVTLEIDSNIDDVQMLTAKEQHHLLYELNDTAVPFAQDKLIYQDFVKFALSHPDNIALMYEGHPMTYQSLNQRVNKIAHYLIAQGVGPDTLVGVCVERNPQMIIGLLAVLKAGGAYVPLVPSLPQSRLQYMLEDTGLQYLLLGAGLQGVLTLDDRVLVLSFNQNHQIPQCADSPITEPPRQSKDGQWQTSDSLAYVIYTSGTTGKPKGVLLPHTGLVSLSDVLTDMCQLDMNSRTLQLTAFGFDVSVLDWVMPLCNGGILYLVNEQMMQDPQALGQYTKDNQINCCYIPPVMLNVLPVEDFASVKTIICAGEQPLPSVIETWSQGRRLINAYGPTETTIIDTAKQLLVAEDASNIGKPFNNVRCYILDKQHKLVPKGVIGELYIGGPCVARGYLNREDLTTEKFIQNPYAEHQDMLYQTGDMVRYNADDDIIFLGRADNQVKIRGFRIELEEIEQQLSSLDEVQSALVLAKIGPDNLQALVAYIIANDKDITNSDITSKLLQHLPEYMVPSAIVFVQNWPLTVNGKIDKRVLPEPDFVDHAIEYQAPQTETERQLVIIWVALLGVDSEKLSTKANFFALGGHSLLSVQLTAQIRSQLHVEVSVKAIFDYPTIVSLAAYVDKQVGGNVRPDIVAADNSGPLPLSFAQNRLWFIDKLQGGSTDYNMPMAIKIYGPFNLAAAEQAIQQIVKRHEVLRTVYHEGDDGPVQVIKDNINCQLKRVDLSQLTGQAQQQKVTQLAIEDATTAFDLANDLMLRASYLQLVEDNSEGVLLFNMHHIASDGWSMNVLMAEFNQFYLAYSQGVALNLPALELQYADYARWQREFIQGEVLAQQLDYWTKQLADAPLVHNLPLDYPRTSMATSEGGLVSGELNGTISEGINAIARQYDATPFMVLHSVLSLLIARYSNNEDVMIGTVVANRMQAELAPLIGFFVNTLVLRTDSSKANTFGEHLQHVRQVNLDAQTWQDIPFESLVEHLQIPRSTEHPPLFQILLSMNNTQSPSVNLSEQIEPQSNVEQVRIEYLESPVVAAKFDLTLSAEVNDYGINLDWTYNKALFKRQTIEQINEHMMVMLEAIATIATKGDMPLSQLPMLTAAQQHHLTVELNNNTTEFEHQVLIHELFDKQANNNPDDIALVCGKQSLSYQALNMQANQVAHYLISQGVGPNTIVGLCVERTVSMLVGILAILKSGGAYLPIVPSMPQERIDFIIEDAELKHVLVGEGLTKAFETNDKINLYQFDAKHFLPEAQSFAQHTPERQTIVNREQNSRDLAYVIYTSGTTGRPKGVLAHHQGLVNSATQMLKIFDLPAKAQVLQLASFSFDASTLDWAETFIHGGTLHIVSEQQMLDPEVLGQYAKDNHIDFAFIPPAMLNVLNLDDFNSLKSIMIGGESPPAALIETWSDSRKLINAYGPTENAVCSSCYILKNQQDATNIGKPLSNVRAYVLDRCGQLVPKGSEGELYLAGVGVGLGYLNRPDLSAEKFIPDPFVSNNPVTSTKDIMYRTGDIVKYNQNDELLFIGRTDLQVKIRGLRIELEEIEQQLVNIDNVQSALVEVQTLSSQALANQSIVAYVLVNHHIDSQTIRATLQQYLPAYMLPDAIVIMDSWPLTVNGKIDRKALPKPQLALSAQTYRAPSTDTERQLVDIWAQLLSIDSDQLSVDSNFFALGGHSLLINVLIKRIKQQLGFSLTISDVFSNQTIASMAKVIDGKQATHQLNDEGSLVLLKAAKNEQLPALFFIHPVGGGVGCYAPLATALNYAGAIYGLQCPSVGYQSVELAASDYIAQIEQHCPQSRYLLAGWSIGGVIAFEMAQQLTAKHQDAVEYLWLIDSICPGQYPKNASDDKLLMQIMVAELGIDGLDGGAYSEEQLINKPVNELLELMLSIGQKQQRLDEDMNVQMLAERLSLLANNEKIVSAYQAKPWHGAALLISATAQLSTPVTTENERHWKSLIGQLEHQPIQGDHFSIVSAENAPQLALLFQF